MDQNRLGLFKHLNDEDATNHRKHPGVKLDPKVERQFQTNPARSGRLHDALFESNFQRLYEGEAKGKYVQPAPGSHGKGAEPADEHGPPAWKPCNPPKHHSGSGDYYGAIGHPYEHMKDREVIEKREKIETFGPANIRTNPVRKGGFGYPHLTIGPTPEYKEEGFGELAKMRREEHLKEIERRKGGPFRNMCVGHDSFDHKNEVFANGGIGPIPYVKKPFVKEKSAEKVPFKLGHWVKSNTDGQFTKRIDYMVEGPVPRKPYTPAVKRTEHPKPFYMPYQNKSLRTPSILSMPSNIGY
eukprot:TRINITY_DN12454_c0_g1::TRINITY_DN12454_c0_g1_i1::g.15055::m.15055 TRINITY_DN12454_c0_g1::TRINITY_DN12454_c0_g1_i1::g.15055  ORF type:complete len:298 (+),score=26.27,sp/Q0P4C5/CD047_DANRE/25.96/3e-08,DUF4586/PF15239.1/1e-31 TRINITY_DN12454_c0_g1_i1:95-988(+)